jgi:hypothetical protein
MFGSYQKIINFASVENVHIVLIHNKLTNILIHLNYEQDRTRKENC